MKGFVEATRGGDLCLTGSSHKAISGQIYRRKHKNMWRSVTNAKNLHQTFINPEESLIHCPALGLLLNRDWTSYVLSLKQQWIKDICWLARITSPSGLKLNHWQILGMRMPRNLFGIILSLGLESFVPLSRTTDCSLIARPSGGIAVT